jgi:hypothetical protein
MKLNFSHIKKAIITTMLITVINADVAVSQDQKEVAGITIENLNRLFSNEGLYSSTEKYFVLQPAEVMIYPITLEKNEKYAIGIACDANVIKIKFELISPQGDVIDVAISGFDEDDPHNIAYLYYKADWLGEYKMRVQVMTKLPSCYGAIVIAQRSKK